MKKSTLTKAEIQNFKETLLQMRRQITGQLSSVSKEVLASDEAKGYSQHQADEGSDDFDRTISIELGNKEQNLLKQVDRALEKIEEGTYGICDITGDNIPKPRLEAIPHATMTVQAQEKLEKGLL